MSNSVESLESLLLPTTSVAGPERLIELDPVLVLGITGAGKSSMLDFLHFLSGIPSPESLKRGNLSGSQTTDWTPYSIPYRRVQAEALLAHNTVDHYKNTHTSELPWVPLSEFLKNAVENEKGQKSWWQLPGVHSSSETDKRKIWCRNVLSDVNSAQYRLAYQREIYQFDIIDGPGALDSRENTSSEILSVAQLLKMFDMLTQRSIYTLSAICVVIKSSMSWDSSSKEAIKDIAELANTIGCQLIVVHSNFEVVRSFQRNSTKENYPGFGDISDRVDASKTHVFSKYTDLNVVHIPQDNRELTDLQWATDFQKAWTVHQLDLLVQKIASFAPTNIRSVRIPKPTELRNLDEQVTRLLQLQLGDIDVSGLSTDLQILLSKSTEKSTEKNKIAQKISDLEDEKWVVLTVETIDRKGLPVLYTTGEDYETRVDVVIGKFEVTVESGYISAAGEGTTVAKIHSSNWWWHSEVKGKVSIQAEGKVRHKARLDELQIEKNQLEVEIKALQFLQDYFPNISDADKQRVKRKRVLEDTISSIKAPNVTLEVLEKLYPIYLAFRAEKEAKLADHLASFIGAVTKAETLFLTGASGCIGSTIAEIAIAEGFCVRSLSSSEESDAKLTSLKSTPVRGDLTTLDVLEQESALANVVVHLATACSSDFSDEDLWKTEKAALDAIAKGLAGSNKRLVVTSSTLIATTDPSGGETNERSPIDSSTGHMRVEAHALSLAKIGINVSIVRLAPFLYGRAGSTICSLKDIATKSGKVVRVDDGNNLTSSVHVDDAARLYLLAARKAKSGDVFNASASTEVTSGEILQAIANGLQIPLVPISFEDACKEVGHGLAWSLKAPNRASGEKARKELDWNPRKIGVLSYITSSSMQL